MENGDSQSLPEQPVNTATPLTVIPRARDTRLEFLKETVAYTLVILSIASVLYVLAYAISSGWHDGAY